MSRDRCVSPLRGRSVLVTGAGFIGGWVCDRLAEEGAEIHVVVRDSGRVAGRLARARLWSADLLRPGAFAEIFRSCRPCVTFNLTGYGIDPAQRDDRRMQRINAELPDEMAAVIAASEVPEWTGARFVHAGSAFEYGPLQGLVDESREPEPQNAYARTKLQATRRIEARVASAGLRAVSARLTTVYGPGEHPHRLLPSLLAAAARGATLDLTAGNQERDFTYVGDVAEGLLRLAVLDTPVPAVVNLASGVLTRVRDFAETAASAIGMPIDRLRFGSLPHREDEVWQGPLSICRLERLTGWRASTTIEDGVRATRAFMTREEDSAS